MIFYFSGTGNTKWAACRLAEATGETLVCMSEHRAGPVVCDLQPGERVGFCFPVHGWRPPQPVRRFVERLCLQAATGHYVYALCTAGDTIGETMRLFEADLRARGIGLDAVFSLLMPESYVGLPFMDVDTAANEKRKQQEAAARLKAYTADIVARRSSRPRLDVGRWPRVNSRLLGSFFVHCLITDGPFRVDSSRCVKCGICADVCRGGRLGARAPVAARRLVPHLLCLLPPLPAPRHRVRTAHAAQRPVLLWPATHFTLTSYPNTKTT